VSCARSLLALLIILTWAFPAVADDTRKKSAASRAASDDGEEEEDEEETSTDPVSQLGDIFTQPVPPRTEGPNWLNDNGDPPRTPPGRKIWRPEEFLDVLYLDNGDILRGHLVREEFPGHYALLIAGNSVVMVPEESVLVRTKERPVHGNRSHRTQVGVLFNPAFGGGLCVALGGEGQCTGNTGAAIDFGGVPAGMKYQVAVSVGVSTAMDITLGGYVRKPKTEDTTYFDPAIGLRHYSKGTDIVKFLRAAEVQFIVKPEFGLRVAALTGVQVDPVRQVGLFVMMGPELEVMPRFVLGFSVSFGVQGRFP
jgi:hypothetical protein